MKISDLKPNQTVEELVIKLEDDPEEKDTRVGKLETFTGSDETGKVSLNLWTKQCGQFAKDDVVKLTNGWCKEFNGALQVSSGKFGTIEKVEEE